jgi:hypothetical protein
MHVVHIGATVFYGIKRIYKFQKHTHNLYKVIKILLLLLSGCEM